MPPYKSPGVYIEEMEAGSRAIEGVSTAVAAFVGFAEKGPFDEPTLVTSWTQYASSFGGFQPGTYLPHAVHGYFLNGGTKAYIVRVGAGAAVEVEAPEANEAAEKPSAQLGCLRVEALEAAPAQPLSVEVSDATPAADGDAPPDGAFRLVVRTGNEVVEEFDRLVPGRGRQNAATVVNAKSTRVRLKDVAGAAPARPDNGAVTLAAAQVATIPQQARPVNVLPSDVAPEEYAGTASDRTGLAGLEAVDDVTMVIVPDLMSVYESGAMDLEGVQTVQQAMIDHCELMGDRMAVLDAPVGMKPQRVRDWRVKEANYDSKFAALYYPWVKVYDPPSGQNRLVPPSGHVAGMWARNDETRGVWKAPANEILRGVVSLEMQLTRPEQEILNPEGINCIRAFPGRGIRVWGARTLSSDTSWRYINVRRLFNYLEESILLGTQWVVFESNDPALWGRIRRTISSFLLTEWRRGALFGMTAEEAFRVQCDSETNPADGIKAGEVVCQVAVAPVTPAEFVIFQLAQYAGGTSLVSEQ